MKKFVIGDIHGGYKALLQCLKRSKFNYKKDLLICVGDVADGWPETALCLEEILKIENKVFVLGNHDQWLMEWLEFGRRPDIWTLQGGLATIKSYLEHPELMAKHLSFLKKASYYYIDDKDRVFVHGGISQSNIAPRDTHRDYLMWDRDLWNNRNNLPEENQYKEIYVGHTSIWNFSETPINYGNVWFMDTGGGWEGKLSIMNIDTKKVWQSDIVADLYKENGRL